MRAPPADTNPAREPMLQFFVSAHLREDLRSVAEAFGELAREVASTLPRNPERTVALRKLLEAKGCAVRALLYQTDPADPGSSC